MKILTITMQQQQKKKLQEIYLKFYSPFFLMKKRRQTVFIQSEQNSSDFYALEMVAIIGNCS